MMRRIIYISGAFFSVVALGAGLYWYGIVPDVFGLFVEEPGEVRTMTLKEETEQYGIDMEYPQFGIPDIDAQIETGINTLVDEFKQDALKSEDSTPHGLTSSFRDVYVDDSIVSAWIAISTYAGGAHPSTAVYGLNFDRKTGKEVGLNYALKLINTSLQKVAETANKVLSENLGESFFAEGAEAKAENYQTFTINAEQVTFIFDEYQVAPYAAGPQGVSFPRVKQ